MKYSCLIALSLLAGTTILPLSANAAVPAYVPNTVNLRAGPGTTYPIVDKIQAEKIVQVYGCLRDYSWCDVRVTNNKNKKRKWESRGWVSTRFLQVAYLKRNGRYEINPRHILDVPAVRFEIASYWDNFYRDMDFYQDMRDYTPRNRDRWDRRDNDWDHRNRDRDNDRYSDRWRNDTIHWND